jgi:hypothetical protein
MLNSIIVMLQTVKVSQNVIKVDRAKKSPKEGP